MKTLRGLNPTFFPKAFVHNALYYVRKFVSLDIFTSKVYGVSDLLLYAKFVDPGIILNTDGSFLKSLWFRGQDLDSSTDDELAYMSHYINMAMCRLGSGWTVHLDCIRRESTGYIKSEDCHTKSRI
jgi:type IV secretory pathway VirB4 component